MSKTDGLPSYNQVLKMDNIATAPLLDGGFAGSIFGTATSIKFEWDSACGPGSYTFLIRDPAGSVHAQGKVDNFNITITNINGSEMFKLLKNDSVAPDRTNSNATTVHKFEVYQNRVHIGSVKFVDTEPAATCLNIFHKSDGDPQMIVRSFKVGDFAIFRDQSSSTPLCNIQMSDASAYAASEFNGTVVFKPETGITAQEQLLCTAAAIGFKVSMKVVTTIANLEEKSSHCIYSTIGIFIFIGIFVLLFFGMEKWGCETKKAKGYAGYVNRQC